MTKEIIYLDLADDITTISAKVTRAKGELVALVLPKSLGTLRNIVNLRLLGRVAEKGEKSLVLVSNNPDILSLAGQVGLRVAKSLHDKPVLPPKPEAAEPKVIEELEETPAVDSATEDAVVTTDPLSDEHLVPKVKLAETESGTKVKSVTAWLKKYKWFIIVPAALLILLVVGALLLIKPAASVEIMAQTRKFNFGLDDTGKISFTRNEAEADPEQGVFLIHEQRLEKASEYEFLPTGEREDGQEARGDIVFNNPGFGASISTSDAVTIDGKTYYSVENSTIRPGQNTLTVRAGALGEEYNQTAAQSFSVKGVSFAASGMNITGGSKRTITVVSQEDYDNALAALPVVNRQAGETELANSFPADLMPLPRAAFSVEDGDPSVTPAIDEETTPDQKALLKQTTTFIGYGVKKADLERFIETKERARIADQPNVRIYDLGFDKMFFGAYSDEGGQMTSRLQTTTVIGPDISAESVKAVIAGKKLSEADRELNKIDGVVSSSIKFNVFWVSKVPTDQSRITVEIEMGD